jgi:hypothetical protein
MTDLQVRWKYLTDLEPRLNELLDEIRNVDGSDDSFCANSVWYEAFKPRLCGLVGWQASKAGFLRSSHVYDVAYERLYQELPDCKNCGCLGVPAKNEALDVESMKDRVMNFVNDMGGGVSFAEIQQEIPGTHGEVETGILEKNIIFWQGVSPSLSEAIRELVQEDKLLEMRPTNELTYLIDGRLLNLPIAKQNRKYVSKRWLPVTFHLLKP